MVNLKMSLFFFSIYISLDSCIQALLRWVLTDYTFKLL